MKHHCPSSHQQTTECFPAHFPSSPRHLPFSHPPVFQFFTPNWTLWTGYDSSCHFPHLSFSPDSHSTITFTHLVSRQASLVFTRPFVYSSLLRFMSYSLLIAGIKFYHPYFQFYMHLFLTVYAWKQLKTVLVILIIIFPLQTKLRHSVLRHAGTTVLPT